MFGVGQKAPYGSVILLFAWIITLYLPNYQFHHPWTLEALALIPHLLHVSCPSMVSCTQDVWAEICTFFKFSFFPPISSRLLTWFSLSGLSPLCKCLVSNFYIPNGHLHIDLPEPHIQVQSQISVCHSHSLHSTTFSELMASMAFLYFLSENSLSDSSLSISSWYPIIKSIHCISTINLPGIFSFPSPSVRPLFFTFYPNSFVQQIITEIYRWPDAAFSCKLYVFGDPEMNR